MTYVMISNILILVIYLSNIDLVTKYMYRHFDLWLKKKTYIKKHIIRACLFFLLKKIITLPQSVNTKLVTYNIKYVGWTLCSRTLHLLPFYSGHNVHWFFVRFCYKFKRKICKMNTIQPYCSSSHVLCANDINPSNCFFL